MRWSSAPNRCLHPRSLERRLPSKTRSTSSRGGSTPISSSTRTSDMTKPKLRIGLIGSGFMGKAHAFGYATATRVFDLPYELELHTIADVDDMAATKAAAALGFSRATSDWRSLVADPAIDVVNITAPNALHKEMA